MGSRIWNILFSRDESPIYRAACSQLKQLESSIKDFSGTHDINMENMTRPYPGDPKSPKIIRITENPETIIIYYPKNSSPYVHSDKRVKHCKIIKGELWLLEGKKHVKCEREFKIEPNRKIVPFTKNIDCIAFIEFEKKTALDNVC